MLNECLYVCFNLKWNEDSGQCQEIGGGATKRFADGPYDYQIITENGLRNGPLYLDGRLYYPIDAEPPFKSIIFTPGFGGESTPVTVTHPEFLHLMTILRMLQS